MTEKTPKRSNIKVEEMQVKPESQRKDGETI